MTEELDQNPVYKYLMVDLSGCCRFADWRKNCFKAVLLHNGSKFESLHIG
jgi:hypothetical protein